MVKKSKIFTIRLDGGRLCLDYLNTINYRFGSITVVDYFLTINDLIDWALRLQILDEDHHRQLTKYAADDPQSAHAFFPQAIALRELLYNIFCRISRDEDIRSQDIIKFNKVISHYFSKLQLKKSNGNYMQFWNFRKGDFHYILAPVVMDAYTLLLDNRNDRIKECPKCGWIFDDKSKNGKRKWCSMQTCGSNVKALEWYHRQKKV